MSTVPAVETEHRTAAKALAWILRISGVVLLLALVAVLLPMSWMDRVHRWLGLGELPKGPIVEYLARSASLLYGVHGALLLYLSLDPRKHSRLIRYIGFLTMGFAAAMTLIDLSAGLPLPWTLFEGPPLIFLAGAIVLLAGRLDRCRS